MSILRYGVRSITTPNGPSPTGRPTKLISVVPSLAVIGTAGSIVTAYVESDTGPSQSG